MSPIENARLSLEGLSVGDAFGDRFFLIPPHLIGMAVYSRTVPDAPWPYTDDTNMALSVVAVLKAHGTIDQEALAHDFVARYSPYRKYGAAVRGLMQRIAGGTPWRTAAGELFDGQGSYGNGAAMRVAPIGAYFADDLDRVTLEARRSAEVTHAHPEGIAGAIAVAIAAALATRLNGGPRPATGDFLDQILPYVPDSEVRSGIRRVQALTTTDPLHIARMVGNGGQISAQDTVPFTLWCAAHYLDRYEDALWAAVSVLGDIDTTCAIIGGIVAPYIGIAGIPAEWIAAREALPPAVATDAG